MLNPLQKYGEKQKKFMKSEMQNFAEIPKI
jgi:hypothetical protein